jgi:hypothetical protein
MCFGVNSVTSEGIYKPRGWAGIISLMGVDGFERCLPRRRFNIPKEMMQCAFCLLMRCFWSLAVFVATLPGRGLVMGIRRAAVVAHVQPMRSAALSLNAPTRVAIEVLVVEAGGVAGVVAGGVAGVVAAELLRLGSLPFGAACVFARLHKESFRESHIDPGRAH